MNLAKFIVDNDKCIRCQNCINVCPGGVLSLNENNEIQISDFKEFGWNGCWKCEHCLAVCPKGAISIFDHIPEDSLQIYDTSKTAPIMKSIVANRHSCRRYEDKNVDKNLVSEMIKSLGNAPNGGNKQQVEFLLVDDKYEMKKLAKIVYSKMEELAQKGIYPEGFDKESYEDMKRWEKTVRPDMLFCGAPHILIPHAPLGKGEPVQDTIIAGTYFEIICAANGLGSVMLTFPLGVLNTMPEIKRLFKIPENHYVGMIIGFGYPEIKYFRGSQREINESRIRRLREELC